MKRRHILRKCWLLSFLLLEFASPATAAVYERDWKMPNDGLLTFDDVSNREWLNLSETIFNNFLGDCATLECVFQIVVSETVADGMFAGFSVATSEDVIALAQSAGIDTTTFDFDTNQAATGKLIDLLSPTAGPLISEGSLASISLGLLNETIGLQRATAFLKYFAPAGPGADTSAGLLTGPRAGGDFIRPASLRVMLYREIVPEPTSGVLFLWAATVFGICQGRRRQAA